MVYNKNAVSAGFDMLTLPKSAAPAKAQSRDEKDSFKSMMDKNVKNAEKDQPKAEQKEETKAPEEGVTKEEAPKQETEGVETQMQEAAAQMVVQLPVFPEQERAALNWGEAPQEMTVDGNASVKPAETAVQEQPVQMQGVQTADNAKTQQISLEGQQVKAEQPAEQQAETVKTAEAAAKPMQEQSAEGKEQQTVVVKQETTDAKVVVQKQQDGLQKQDAVKADVDVAETDAAEAMASAPKEMVSKEAELVQVKVSDKINLTSAQAADDLAETVLVKAAENTNEYELQLAPEELGKIKIKLVIENGKISVAMSCENQKAADMLAATGGRLKAVIEERTGSEAFVHVEQEEQYQNQEKEGQNNGRGQEQQNRKQQETSQEELADFMQQLRLGLLNLN